MSGDRYICRLSPRPSSSPTRPSEVAALKEGDLALQAQAAPDRTQTQSPPALYFVLPLEDKNPSLFLPRIWGAGEECEFTPHPTGPPWSLSGTHF